MPAFSRLAALAALTFAAVGVNAPCEAKLLILRQQTNLPDSGNANSADAHAMTTEHFPPGYPGASTAQGWVIERPFDGCDASLSSLLLHGQSGPKNQLVITLDPDSDRRMQLSNLSLTFSEQDSGYESFTIEALDRSGAVRHRAVADVRPGSSRQVTIGELPPLSLGVVELRLTAAGAFADTAGPHAADLNLDAFPLDRLVIDGELVDPSVRRVPEPPSHMAWVLVMGFTLVWVAFTQRRRYAVIDAVWPPRPRAAHRSWSDNQRQAIHAIFDRKSR
ncbi:hypothetical protein [Pseudobythopirellula maris]|nr:hypothetical protein [Pseudobythopirellula maris]